MSDEQKPVRLCANCTYSMMYRAFGFGRCELRLPPWMNAGERHGDREIRFDDTCSFHEARDG